jgi:hypothetical protein
LKRFVVTLAAAALVGLAATPAQAASIRITPTGWAPDDYQNAGYPVDPAIIGSDGFRLTYWGAAGETLVNPVMLILAVPEGSPAPLTPVPDNSGEPDAVVSVASTSYYGANSWDTSTGKVLSPFNSTSTKNVYDFIGFKPSGNSSENYANWNKTTGLTGWNLFVYTVEFTPQLGKNDYVEFATSLPVGSFVIGYGCTSTVNGACSGTGNTQSTPFTFAGAVGVPEPASVTLMLSGLGMALARARRRRA